MKVSALPDYIELNPLTACDHLELTGCFFPKLETSFECEVTNTFTGRTSMINKRIKLSWFEANMV